jgi:uncharacterized membrane protein YecN with MAPEG domain
MFDLQFLLWPALVTVASLILYFVTVVNVGRARQKYQVFPPAIAGNPNFERVYRVQQNTLEQALLFLPSLWLFALTLSAAGAAIVGLVWLIGRVLFAWGYYQAAEKRFLGFGLASTASMVLLLGACFGVLRGLVRLYF